MDSVSNFSFVSRFGVHCGHQTNRTCAVDEAFCPILWTVQNLGNGRNFTTRSTPRSPNCESYTLLFHWRDCTCNVSADHRFMHLCSGDFWLDALTFWFLVFARHLARLLHVEYLGLWIQFLVPSFPRPPRVSSYWHCAAEHLRVEPARVSFRTIFGGARTWKQRNFLIQNLFSFGIHHSFNTVGWHWVIKENGIGSSLPES